MTMPFSAETLLLEGADAPSFAHTQFSSAVTSLLVGRWQFSAWLDPKGRVLALFHLVRLADDRFLLLLRGGSAAAMAAALQRFVFRSRVHIQALPPRGLSTGPALPQGVVVLATLDAGSNPASATDDHAALSLGCDSHSLRITNSDSCDDAWRLLQLRSGWPWLVESHLGTLLPASLSLLRLHAVAVDKGCYPGQEIVARLHFRGGHKRHLHRVTLPHETHPGETLRASDRDVGCVVDVVASGARLEALVLLNDEMAGQANDGAALRFDNGVEMALASSWPA